MSKSPPITTPHRNKKVGYTNHAIILAVLGLVGKLVPTSIA